VSTYSDLIAAEASLANYWRIGEAGSTAADDKSANTITLGGTYTREVAGLLDNDANKATSLDGVTGYGTAAARTLNGATAFSAECWFRRAGAPNGASLNTHHSLLHDIMGDAGYPRLQVVEATGAVLFAWRDGTGTYRQHLSTGVDLRDGLRHPIIATHDGTVSALYVDGAARGTPTTSSLHASSTGILAVGRYGAGVYQANGTLDELALYSAALSAASAEAHHSAGHTRTGSGGAIALSAAFASAAIKAATGSGGAIAATAAFSGAGSKAVTASGVAGIVAPATFAGQGVHGWWAGTTGTVDWIEAWATDSGGTYLGHLDRALATPFRNFAFSWVRRDAGVCSLEFNERLVAGATLFARGNLVWMRYRGTTRTYLCRGYKSRLDESESASEWTTLAAPGVRALMAHRQVWPDEFDETHLDPSAWMDGKWATKTDASAASGQPVVPVVSTTTGDGASVDIPVEIVGGGFRQLGIIESIVAGVSVTLEEDLKHTFPKGSRIVGAARQWHRVVNREPGEMVWDMIAASNARFPAQIAKGTIDHVGTGWTQDFRFETIADVMLSVEQAGWGEFDFDGLTLNFSSPLGVDRTASVIFEEGADLKVAEADPVGGTEDPPTWIVAQGTGSGVFAPLAVAVDATAPIRVEAFLDASDVQTAALLQTAVDGALAQAQAVADAVSIDASESRFAAFTDYGPGDQVSAITTRGNITGTVVAMYVAEVGDLVVTGFDLNSPRTEKAILMAEAGRATARSLGTGQRQPQGQLTSFSVAGSDVFDSDDTCHIGFWIPDRIQVLHEAKVLLRFRQFFASAKSATSGGGSTSGSGGSSTETTADGNHAHEIGTAAADAGALTMRDVGGISGHVRVETDFTGAWNTSPEGLPGYGHTHEVSVPAHTHSTPAHAHGITYGIYKEAAPATIAVDVTLWEYDGDDWVLRYTFATITAWTSTLDLMAGLAGPGAYELRFLSAAGAPNGGRLGVDASGFAFGAIQAE
jgi:hypothetical protein